jgi:hypothetical protein
MRSSVDSLHSILPPDSLKARENIIYEPAALSGEPNANATRSVHTPFEPALF